MYTLFNLMKKAKGVTWFLRGRGPYWKCKLITPAFWRNLRQICLNIFHTILHTTLEAKELWKTADFRQMNLALKRSQKIARLVPSIILVFFLHACVGIAAQYTLLSMVLSWSLWSSLLINRRDFVCSDPPIYLAASNLNNYVEHA